MDISKYFSKVFLWMCIGLACTFITGQVIANSPTLTAEVFSGWYFLIVIVQLAVVIFLSARIHRMSAAVAKITFIVYSILTGLTFSSIFITYKIESIIYVFLITSIVMLIFSLIGFYTKKDLSKFGTYLFMALIAMIILGIINLFIGSSNFDLAICCISVLVFIGFIAYDVNKIKKYYFENPDNENLAIIGALELYLDFINIFIDLIRIFGDNN